MRLVFRASDFACLPDLTADGTPVIIHGLSLKGQEKARPVGAAAVPLLVTRGLAAETIRLKRLFIGGLI
jgi:hypothetical protein